MTSLPTPASGNPPAPAAPPSSRRPAPARAEPGRGRAKLLAMAAVFALPLALALLVYFVLPEWIPSHTTNYGTLLPAARPAGDLALVDPEGAPAPDILHGKWTLVQLAGAGCDADCGSDLIMTRQVRATLNEKRIRVRRLYVAADAAAAAAARTRLAGDHPDLEYAGDPQGLAQRFFDQPARLYLVDPLGNWLMLYTAPVEPAGLRKDIKKLLRVSQIG